MKRHGILNSEIAAVLARLGHTDTKGVGEPALIPQAAAIVNAIHDATGVWMRQLPCDIERLKLALEKNKENKR